jgi:hypothetical protein
MPTEIAGSRPSSRRTISARLAHGQALAAISRYRPAWTGHPDEPSEVMRSVNVFADRVNACDIDCTAPMKRRVPLPPPVKHETGDRFQELRVTAAD